MLFENYNIIITLKIHESELTVIYKYSNYVNFVQKVSFYYKTFNFIFD